MGIVELDAEVHHALFVDANPEQQNSLRLREEQEPGHCEDGGTRIYEGGGAGSDPSKMVYRGALVVRSSSASFVQCSPVQDVLGHDDRRWVVGKDILEKMVVKQAYMRSVSVVVTRVEKESYELHLKLHGGGVSSS